MGERSAKRVLEAIRSGPNQRIAVLFVEWSGLGNQKVLIDWTLIDGPQPARDFGDKLIERACRLVANNHIGFGRKGAKIGSHDGEAALFRDDMLAFWRRVLRGQPDR